MLVKILALENEFHVHLIFKCVAKIVLIEVLLQFRLDHEVI